MSLDSVIEDSIKKFLDAEIIEEEEHQVTRHEDTGALYANREWEKNIKQFLKKNDINNAKKEFNELKKLYGEVPENHAEERKRLYEALETSYVLIYNFANERARTRVLLQQLATNPDAVFNTSVKPIDIQKIEHAERLQLPDFEPLTRQALQQRLAAITSDLPAIQNQFKPATPGDAFLSLPDAPTGLTYAAPQTIGFATLLPGMTALPGSGQVPGAGAPGGTGAGGWSGPVGFGAPGTGGAQRTGGAQGGSGGMGAGGWSGPVGFGGPVAQQGTPQPTIPTQEQAYLRANLRLSLRRAATVARTAPERALMLIDTARDHVKQAFAAGVIQQQDAQHIDERLDHLESATKQHQEQLRFTKQFNEIAIRVSALARVKNANALTLYQDLVRRTEDFEKIYPHSKPVFSAKIKQLQETFNLYTEDVLVDAIKPYLLRIKHARRGTTEWHLAIDDLDHFTAVIPDNPEKQMLVDAINTLKHKPAKPATTEQLPEKPKQHLIEKHSPANEDAIIHAIEPFLLRMKFATNRKDSHGFIKALDDLDRYTAKLPDPFKNQCANIVKQIHQKIDAKRAVRTSMTSNDVMNQTIKPYLRRITTARARKDVKELQLAIESFARYLRTLPEEQRIIIEQLLVH